MLVLIIKMIINVFPFKVNLCELIYGTSEMSNTYNLLSCAFICFGTCYLALVFPDISDVLGISGGIACVNICFLVPLLIYLGLRKPGTSLCRPKYAVIILFFLLFIIFGLMSVYVSLKGLIQAANGDTF
mmetsp:Transcript_49167/g.36220  ORF Transcript_49167/g.36220 Transcript_49167/m.36220 type:complete len:129 (-) Transcript_49167:39-425(-)